MKRTVKESINQRYLLAKTEEELIKVLNPKITGWRNYYKTRNDRKWMRAIDWYILCTFCRWNNKKRQQTRKLKGLYATKIRLQEKGLQLMAAWRNAVERRMSESRMRENLTYGLMRGKRAKALWPTLPYASTSMLTLDFNSTVMRSSQMVICLIQRRTSDSSNSVRWVVCCAI